jgi:hypothetical protein
METGSGSVWKTGRHRGTKVTETEDVDADVAPVIRGAMTALVNAS